MTSFKNLALPEDELVSCMNEKVRCFLYLKQVKPGVKASIFTLPEKESDANETLTYKLRLCDVSTGEFFFVPFKYIDRILATIESEKVSKSDKRRVLKASRRLSKRHESEETDRYDTIGEEMESIIELIENAQKTGYDFKLAFPHDLAKSILDLDDGATFMKLFSARDTLNSRGVIYPLTASGFAEETVASVIPKIDHEHVNILRSMMDRFLWQDARIEEEQLPSYLWDCLVVRAVSDERASQLLSYYFEKKKNSITEGKYVVCLFGFDLTLKSLGNFLFASPNYTLRILNRDEEKTKDKDGERDEWGVESVCRLPVDLGKFCNRAPSSVFEFEDEDTVYVYDEKIFCEMYVELFGHCDGFSGVPDGNGGLVERTLRPWSALKTRLESLEKLQAGGCDDDRDEDSDGCVCLPKKIKSMYSEEERQLPGMSRKWSRPSELEVLGYHGGLGEMDADDLKKSRSEETWGFSSLLFGFFAGLESAFERDELPPIGHVRRWLEKLYEKQGRSVLYCMGDLMRTHKGRVQVFDLLKALDFL